MFLQTKTSVNTSSNLQEQWLIAQKTGIHGVNGGSLIQLCSAITSFKIANVDDGHEFLE